MRRNDEPEGRDSGVSTPRLRLHDHVLRASDNWEAAIRYIAANPIAFGLADRIRDWPYTGSIGADLNGVLDLPA